MLLHEEYGLTSEQLAELRIKILKLPLRLIERKTEAGWDIVSMKELHDKDHIRVSFPATDFEFAGEMHEFIVEGEPSIDEEYRWKTIMNRIKPVKE
jgi:hypothetical protein